MSTTILTAALGVLNKQPLAHQGTFDWVALVAVLTTVSGLVLVHMEASRFDFLIVNYRSAARQLRAELAALPEHPVVPSAGWSWSPDGR